MITDCYNQKADNNTGTKQHIVFMESPYDQLVKIKTIFS